MFINDALATTGVASNSQDILVTIFQLALIFLIFYLLLIRPQQKKMKEHNNRLNALKVGDSVVTGGGIYAKVTKINGQEITVEISNNVEVVVNRLSIRDVLLGDKSDKKQKAEKDTAKKTVKKSEKSTEKKSEKTNKK